MRLHAVDLLGGEHRRQIVALLHADAMLAGDGAAHLDAHLQDATRQRLGALQRARLRGHRKG